MKDDDKYLMFTTPRQGGKTRIFSEWLRSFAENAKINPKYIAVDWAKDSGMNRGDVIKRDKNVTHVRFQTATI